MCTSPIRIVNKTRGFKDGITRYDMYVPCGQCEECRHTKAEQWLLRIYDTFLEYKDGVCIFLTPTYDEEHLPRHYYTHADGSERSFPCFDKSHKDEFLRSIQDYFRYHLNHRPTILGKDDMKLPIYNEDPVRFIWCSEYGLDQTKTQRPHYHVLLFIPKVIWDKLPHHQKWWKKFLNDRWKYGMVRFSPEPQSIFVNSSFACVYCSKYISKSINFYTNPEVKAYFDQCIIDGVRNDDLYRDLLKKVKAYLPNHWQSPYFGASLQKKFDNKSAYIDGVYFGFKSELEKGKCIYHKCPQYIERRMLTSWDNSTHSYQLTPKGIEYKFEKFEKNIFDYANKFNKLLDKRYLKFLLKDESVFQDVKVLRRFKDIDDLYKYITSILEKVSTPVELYLYNRVWSGALTTKKEDLLRLDSMSYFEFLQESKNQYLDSLTLPFDDYVEEGYFHVHSPDDEENNWYSYSACSRFIGFAQAIKVFGAIYNVYNKLSSEQYEKDLVNRKNNKFNIKTA